MTAVSDLNDILGIDLGTVHTNAPASPMEQALAEVTPAEQTASTPEEAAFQFRTLLAPEALEALQKRAPAITDSMIADLNQVLTFGAPVLKKMNDASVSLLEAQKDIKLPDADDIVNGLLREMDNFEKKYRNKALEEKASKVGRWFKGSKNSIQAMVQESQPIAQRLDMAEAKLYEMEGKIGDNIARGQYLHQQTLEHLDDVVKVLAALEEIQDCARSEFADADGVLKAAEGEGDNAVCEWKGEKLSLAQMREVHTQLATAVSEIEKTWFDWRQQFFIGFAHAPSTRNLVITEFAMRRRLQTFRTMGLPSARHSLAMWQQAALARQGAELGAKVGEGTNRLIQQSFKETADAVTTVAHAAQAPVIDESTVFTVIESVRQQCQGIVAAENAGRELRARNLKALEAGEATIRDEFVGARRASIAGTTAPQRQAITP
ncbi:MAG: toxic anion resistance protein [Cellulomonadaceae bacterium]|jgi:uncharacterized protein YaaN involved in tellurite resistance|nr:toxic anion resistance protein [Cellulomonadaceae bacterium]